MFYCSIYNPKIIQIKDNLTQKDLAAISGLSEAMVSRMFKNLRNFLFSQNLQQSRCIVFLDPIIPHYRQNFDAALNVVKYLLPIFCLQITSEIKNRPFIIGRFFWFS